VYWGPLSGDERRLVLSYHDSTTTGSRLLLIARDGRVVKRFADRPRNVHLMHVADLRGRAAARFEKAGEGRLCPSSPGPVW
jgi:hypothetical protein